MCYPPYPCFLLDKIPYSSFVHHFFCIAALLISSCFFAVICCLYVSDPVAVACLWCHWINSAIHIGEADAWGPLLLKGASKLYYAPTQRPPKTTKPGLWRKKSLFTSIWGQGALLGQSCEGIWPSMVQGVKVWCVFGGPLNFNWKVLPLKIHMGS